MRLSDDALEGLMEQIGLPEIGRKVVRALRNREPLRRVAAGNSVETGRYPSHLTGLTVQWEGRLELAHLRRLHADPAVLEVWDQAIELVGGGRRQIVDYTVIRTDSVVALAVMPESDVTGSIAAGESRYRRGADGLWHEPLIDEAAERLGFRAAIGTEAEVPPVLSANVHFLMPYHDYPVDPEYSLAVHRLLREQPGLSIAELLRVPEFTGTVDRLYPLIARGDVHADDLSTVPLRSGDRVRLFPSATIAALAAPALVAPRLTAAVVTVARGERIEWDGAPWEIANVGSSVIEVVSESGWQSIPREQFERLARAGLIRGIERRLDDEVAARVARATGTALERAAVRSHHLALAGAGVDVAVPERTLRRWRSKARTAEGMGLPTATLLIDGHRSGRGPQLPAPVEALVQRTLETQFAAPEAPRPSDIVRLIEAACEDAGLAAPADRTIYRRVTDFRKHKVTEARLGKRAAYRDRPPVLYIDWKSPVHGDRPWEWAHIDHTEMDVEVVDRETGLNLGRPWLSLLVDAHTRRVLAAWLTMRPPNRATVLSLFRACAERWGRLPEAVVLDGGREFGSRDVETFAALHGVMLVRRPGKPRFGAVIERLFGTTDRMFVHSLAGNTKATKQVRAMSREVNPKGFAVWDLASLYAALAVFLFDDYDRRDHPALGRSPRAAYLARMEITGQRPHRLLVLDPAFRVLTMPSTRKGTARVKPGDGVSVNGRYYTADALDRHGVAKSDVEVRYDPDDIRHAWALVDHEWVEVFCLAFRGLPPCSDEEMSVLSGEMAERPNAIRRSREQSDIEIGRDFAVIRLTEARLRQRAKDRANALTAQLALSTFDDYRPLLAQLTGGDPEGTPRPALSLLMPPAAPLAPPSGAPAEDWEVTGVAAAPYLGPEAQSGPDEACEVPDPVRHAVGAGYVRPSERHVPAITARDVLSAVDPNVPMAPAARSGAAPRSPATPVLDAGLLITSVDDDTFEF